MFFRHMHLFFLDSCPYPFYLPIRKLTKIYIPFEKLLWTILCSEEHTWEITESGEFRELECYFQYHCWEISGWGLGTYSNDLIFYCHSWMWQTLTEGSTRPSEHRNVPTHPHLLTQLLSELNLTIVEVLQNLSTFILQSAVTSLI